MLRTDPDLLGKTQSKMTDQTKESNDIKEDEERLKGHEKKENILVFHL